MLGICGQPDQFLNPMTREVLKEISSMTCVEICFRSSLGMSGCQLTTGPDSKNPSSVPDRDFNPSTKEKINFFLKFEEKIPSTEAQNACGG